MHPACVDAVRGELCTIVTNGTMEGTITIPVVMVDQLLYNAYPHADGGREVVHLLKSED